MLLEFKHFIFNVRFLVILIKSFSLYLQYVWYTLTYWWSRIVCILILIIKKCFSLNLQSTQQKRIWISISTLMKIWIKMNSLINTEVHQYLYALLFLELLKISFKSMELCGWWSYQYNMFLEITLQLTLDSWINSTMKSKIISI